MPIFLLPMSHFRILVFFKFSVFLSTLCAGKIQCQSCSFNNMNIGIGGLANNADVGSSYVFEDCVFGCSRDICEIAVAAIDGADFKGVSFMDVTVRVCRYDMP